MAFPGPRAAVETSISRAAWVAILAVSTSLLFGGAAHCADSPTPKLELHKGDHISIVGNTWPIHAAWLKPEPIPRQDLSVRNLGFAADELTTRAGTVRHPRDWLQFTPRRGVCLLWLQRVLAVRPGNQSSWRI